MGIVRESERYMKNLDDYKVDNLFLLIGENPLPNYVAARTLLNESGTVYLVFTNQTKSQKNCLKNRNVLQQHNIKTCEVYLENDGSNAYEIHKKIQKKCLKLPNTQTLGLNYTGGTKAMAVHAYRTIQECNTDADAVFSYLDSRTLKMWIDREGNQPLQFDVTLDPPLNLETLFKLHNNNEWLDNKPPRSEPVLPEIEAKFAEFHRNEKLKKEWRNWCGQKLHPLTKEKTKVGFKWKEEDDLNCTPPIRIRLNGLSKSIKKILRENLDTSTENLQLNITKQKGFDSLTHVCEWLDGTWLESYVLQQVKEIQNKFGIKESMMSFHVRDSQKTWRERFEFDVAFIKGYQLFAISCTTSSEKDLCKQKALRSLG